MAKLRAASALAARVACGILPGMTATIFEADENGTLHLLPMLLPHPGPRRRYRVTAEGGQVVVDEVVSAEPAPAVVKWDIEELRAWKKKVWGDRIFTEEEVAEMREFERGDS